MISANASVDAGAVGDPDFSKVRFSYQTGLRIGLPPDWGMKARIDMGWGDDQSIFMIQFGEVF
jgi:hypothetical protein